MQPASAAAVSTVTTADDGWYRDVTSFAQHTGWLHSAMSAYTILSIGVLCLMLLYAWWSARQRADRAAMAAVLWTALGSVVCVAASLALKQVFTETRPCLALAPVATVQPCPGPSDYSFPSDHTTIAAALAVGLWLVHRRLGVIAVALTLIEGFSRVYLGQHYPHDVVAALILSAVIMLVGWLVLRRLLERAIGALEATPLRPVFTTAR